MKQTRITKILSAPPLRLTDLAPGDKVQGFEGWGCVPDNATRTVMKDEDGLYVCCTGDSDAPRSGQKERHYLDGQVGDDGVTLLGMCRA